MTNQPAGRRAGTPTYLEGGLVAVTPAAPSGVFPVVYGDSPAISAFGDLRTSQKVTLWQSQQTVDFGLTDTIENNPLFWDNAEISGGGTGTLYSVARASTTLSVSATTAGVRARQTRQRFQYQPGKSQLALLTFANIATGAGVTKRVGLFDGSNGLFLQHSDGVAAFVIRSSVSGSPVDTVIPQSSWNVDQMNGTGISGITLDFSKVQIFTFDFEWLGVGRVRFGFVVDGLIHYAHSYSVANSGTAVYMSTPNLPVRYEIRNSGAGAAETFETICSTVISEGGIQPAGAARSFSPTDVVNNATFSAAATTYAMSAIRLNAAALGATVSVVGIAINLESAADIIWSLHVNPTLSAGLSYNRQPQSSVDAALVSGAAPSVTAPGFVISSGFVNADVEERTVVIDTIIRLGSSIAGVADEFVLCARGRAASQAAVGFIQWVEL